MQLFLFDLSAYESSFYKSFLKSELGQIYLTIPFRELATQFDPFVKQCPQGAKATFSVAGGLGLMFLKHYLGLSDSKLIKRVNHDWQLQFFCGLNAKLDHGIKDKDLVGRWRRFFGLHMDMKALQDCLTRCWNKDLDQSHVSLMDATAYESHIAFPTDVKLLWTSVTWVKAQLDKVCDLMNFAMPRSKYKEQKVKQVAYMKKRKKTHKEELARRKSLLYLLKKLLGQLQCLLNAGGKALHCQIKPKVFDRLKVIRQVVIQQQYHLEQPAKPIPHRIVSLYKPYVRPIVRGKENKRVEFGAKVHQLQVGGCNFIEHLDFEAFHEGNRLIRSVWQHQHWFGKTKQLAADGIYANNRNRRWCRQQQIATNFVPKGRQGVHKDQAKALRQTLSVIRATALEGSFGNHKNHYLLDKIRARTYPTEIAWIFFGVHTANAVKIAKARAKKQKAQLNLALGA